MHAMSKSGVEVTLEDATKVVDKFGGEINFDDFKIHMADHVKDDDIFSSAATAFSIF